MVGLSGCWPKPKGTAARASVDPLYRQRSGILPVNLGAARKSAIFLCLARSLLTILYHSSDLAGSIEITPSGPKGDTMMNTWTKNTALAIAAAGMIAAAPASATVFEYTMTNGDIVTIDTANGSGTWKGASIDKTFTGDFSSFQGGPTPSFMGELSSLTGTRIINGKTVTATTQNGNRFHPFMLKTKDNGMKFNLWAWWGDPVISGDYIQKIGSFKVVPPVDVPAPGALGLFGLALVALGFGRRRRREKLAAA
jgi:hypothetical protein